MTRKVQKVVGLVSRQRNGVELKMLGTLAHDLLVHVLVQSLAVVSGVGA